MHMKEKESVRRQFSRNAKDYRDEPLFAEGFELAQMVRSVAVNGTERVLDVGSGAGHTALAFAPYVSECIGCDLTMEMVEVATTYAREQGAQNVVFQIGDAEDLPFPDASFDLVTCRFAAHHFPNTPRALHEISRVLKSGGVFLLVDHYAPEDPQLDAFINTLDSMRDPSHVREHRLTEYQSWFAAAGMSYHEKLRWNLTLDFEKWVQRARTPDDIKEKLMACLRNADFNCKETFCIQCDPLGVPTSFCLKCVLLQGLKK